MSPEQADLTGADIDTRTDVYLAGRPALRTADRPASLRPEEMRKVRLDGMLYMIRSVDPPRPSVRLKEAGHEADDHAAAPRALSRDKLVSRLPVIWTGSS